MTVTVFSKPNCQPCKATKRKLEQLNIDYTAIDISTDEEAASYVTEDLGYTSAPVVEVDLGDEAKWTWHGYAPTQLERLSELMAA